MLRSTTSETVALSYDDLIFQARHRAYGAFDLRRHYRPTLTRALGLGVGLFLLGLSVPTIYARLFPANPFPHNQVMVETELLKLPEPPIEEMPVALSPVPMPVAQPTARYLMPVVVMDAPEEMPVATVDELKDAAPSNQTTDGTGEMDIILPPETTTPTLREIAVEAEPKTEGVFILVEQQPEYPGGMEALRAFLRSTLKYPGTAASAGISGRVFVHFVVNTDGSLADIQVLKGIGFGCDEEAIRVIQKMPRWKPGKQSDRAVRVTYNLPISFTLE
ncbi:energy transducer TonB [Spirosoma areae]